MLPLCLVGKVKILSKCIELFSIWKPGDNLLREILEAKLGVLTDSEFNEIKGLVVTDILVNRIDFGKQTSLAEEVEIAEYCGCVKKHLG